MKALVTGAGGFIGSHLVERLLNDGHKVVGLDLTKSKFFKTIHNNKNCRLVNMDLAKVDKLNRFFRGIDWVFHLAGASDIVPSIIRPLVYHAANVTATVNVLEVSRRAGVKRFIYAASSSCYGIPDAYPTPETAPIRPLYPYAFTKYLGEQYSLHWEKVYRLPVVSLRLFNVYGPRSRVSPDYGPVFSTFMAQKLAGKPFTVVGDGKQTRDFTFVSDVVEAFITAAKSNVTGEVFNVGSGGTYSINQLVKLIDGAVVYIHKRPAEPDCTWADISKINKVLKWKPKVPFPKGVKIVLGHINDWKDATIWTPRTIKHATKVWFKYLNNK